MKYIVIVPDGMADYPIEELGQKTPLEAAHRPIYYLAQNGCGVDQNHSRQLEAGLEIGNLSLLGYNPDVCFTGRAPLRPPTSALI